MSDNTINEELTNPVKDEAPVVETAPVVEAPVVSEPAPEAAPEAPEAPVEAPKPAEDVITGPKGSGASEEQILAPVLNGAIGTATVAKTPKAPKKSEPTKLKHDDTVAIFSTRNVHWEGVGRLSTGYNIVSKEAAEKWLTRGHVRSASPEEVAREFKK
jgi:hypothetical protein